MLIHKTEDLTESNGLKVLNNDKISIKSPVKYNKKRNPFDILKSRLNIF